MVQSGPVFNEAMILKQCYNEEIENLKLEIQQCKDFIKIQQQLLQVSQSHSSNELISFVQFSLFLFLASLFV